MQGARWRSHEKTEFLISVWDPGILWDKFGIRAEIVVRFLCNPSRGLTMCSS